MAAAGAGRTHARARVQVVHNNVRFAVWDLGGQDSLREVWSTYFIHTHVRRPALCSLALRRATHQSCRWWWLVAQAILLVVDSTDRARIGLVKKELNAMMAHQVRVRLRSGNNAALCVRRLPVACAGPEGVRVVGAGQQTGRRRQNVSRTHRTRVGTALD